MTVALVALAIAVLLLPGESPAAARVDALRSRGRLPVGKPPRPGGVRRVLKRGAAARGIPVLLGAAVALVGVRGGPVLGAAAAILAAAGWWLVRGTRGRRRRQRARSERLSAVQLLAAELAAGGTPAAALEAAASACSGTRASAFSDAADLARTGAAPGEGLGRSDPLLARLGTAWQVAESSGAPLAEVLRRCADDLAAESEQERAVSVALAGPRSSALLLAGLPLLGLGLGAAMGAAPLTFLFGPSGRVVLLVGIVLDVAGVLWTQRLLVRAERAQ